MATKSTAKKTAKAKPSAKKAATAKPAAKAAPAIKPVKETLTKSALIEQLAAQADVDKKQVKAVLAALENTMLGSVHKRGVGTFTLPGLFKVNTVKVPAKPKRKGVNPFTGEEQVFAAKKATVKIKVRPLKKLKDAAL